MLYVFVFPYFFLAVGVVLNKGGFYEEAVSKFSELIAVSSYMILLCLRTILFPSPQLSSILYIILID